MKIVVIIGQVVVGLLLAGGGFWLYSWHKDHPGANVKQEIIVQDAPAADANPELTAGQKLIQLWIKDNLTDRTASISRCSEVLTVKGNQCLVASIEGKTRSGRKLVRTYVFEYKGTDLLQVRSGEDFVKDLTKEAKEAATAAEDAEIQNKANHFKLILAEMIKNDSQS
ncbi:MAG: hypothetical protein ACAI34_01665 [Verrucomicrobium sp.]|nr:hypothetical protein [Verrucomicrobium sp.]